MFGGGGGFGGAGDKGNTSKGRQTGTAQGGGIFGETFGNRKNKLASGGGPAGGGGFGNFAAADTGGGFGAAPKKSATSSGPSWAAIATNTPATNLSFGSGGGFGFGSGGGFGGGTKTASDPKPAAAPSGVRPTFGGSSSGFGGFGQPKATATKLGFGTGGGFVKEGGTTASSSLTPSTNPFGTQKEKQPVAAASPAPAPAPTRAGGSFEGGVGLKSSRASPAFTSSGVSFADAAKRGADSSASGNGGSDGTGGLPGPASKLADKSSGFGTKVGWWGESGGTFSSTTEGPGKAPKRSNARGFAGAQKATGSGRDQSVPTTSLAWGGGLLSASVKAAARKRGSTSGDRGGADGNRMGAEGDSSRAYNSSVSFSSGNKREKSKGRKAGPATTDSTAEIGERTRSRIMGGFGATPPGNASSGPTAFKGGGTGSASMAKTATSKEPSSGRSKIMGMFGDPPPATSSDPPAFVGGESWGSGSSNTKSKSNRVQSVEGSKILGGFGGPPPGASLSPPAFVGGGGDSSGGSSSGFGATAADDSAAKARRAQRFASARHGGGGISGGIGGKTRSGGEVVSGAGSSGDGGSAEDVQRGSHLDDAEIKQGTVEGMCPLEELSRRVPGDLHVLEKEHPSLFKPDDGNGDPPRLWAHEDLVVKRHQRAAAGTDISKPELLRTPLWLARTVDHLVMNCVDKGPHGGGDPAAAWDDPRLHEYMAKFRANNPSRADSAEEETEHDLYNFVWDRFRMVRSDYNMQGFNPVVGLVSEASIVAHERMARWYVLMANRMEKNTMQTHRFNLKSIVETLKKLYEFYTIRVSRGEVSGGLASPNEPEIMAYYLLTVLEQDDGVEVQRLVKDLVRSRREEVLNSPEIKGALKIVRAWHAGDYVAFFRAFRQQEVMHRCLLSQYVRIMRNTAITMISASFSDFSLSEMMRLLCFESQEQAVEFLRAYNLKVSDAGHVHLRMKDQSGTWRIPFRHPETIPDPPPLQDLVEPKPWRYASEWVFKGDYELTADKSHDVTASSQRRGAARGAAALRRATSTSSTGSAAERGASRTKAPRKGKPGGLVREGIGATPRSSGSQAGSSPTKRAAATFPYFSPDSGSPANSAASAGGSAWSGAGDAGAAARAGAHAGSVSTGAFTSFGASAAGKMAPSDHSSSGQPPNDSQQTSMPSWSSMSSPTAPSASGGFVFAPRDHVSGGQGAPVSNSTTSGAFASEGAFPPLGRAKEKLEADRVGSVIATTDPSAQTAEGRTRVALGSSVTPPESSFSVPLNRTPTTALTPSAVAAIAGAATNVAPPGACEAPASLAAGSGRATGKRRKASSTQSPDRDRAEGNSETSGVEVAPGQVTLGRPSAAAVQGTVKEDEKRAMDAAQRRERAEAEEARRKEQELAKEREAAVAAAARAAREAECLRDAESRAERALADGRVVPSDVVDKLVADSKLQHLALDRRKALGLRLAQLGVSVLRRKRSAAWSLWMEETRLWLEEQHLIVFRNRRFEEHSALTDHASFLRRNKISRSLSLHERASSAGSAAAKVAAKVAAAAAAVQRRHVEPRELRLPRPLNLPAVVAPAVAKNQGINAEEAFRAVGLTTGRSHGMKRREQEVNLDGPTPPPTGSPLTPPHLFWKAVVVAPSRTRGNVGAWLEAKFGGEEARASTYRQDLANHGFCSRLEDSVPLVEEHKEVACGISANSRLMYRALSALPRTTLSLPSSGDLPHQWIHLCVQRVSVKVGCRLSPSEEVSRTLKAASVVVFAATPRDQDRFFWSPLHPKPDWSQAREDLHLTLDPILPGEDGGKTSDGEFLGVPILIVLSVKDSALQRDASCASATPSEGVQEAILEEAWRGLGLRVLAERGFSFRVTLVGLHEFESRSKAAAATAEGLVFAGRLEETCSKDMAMKLAELAALAPRQPLVATRCLKQMLNTAVSRATTDDRHANAVGLNLSVSRYEDPPLDAVVGAATRATEQVRRLLTRKSSAWPIPEFAVAARVTDGNQRAEVVYVPGAARAAGGEISVSPLLALQGAAAMEANNTAHARLRRVVAASGGLPVDWAFDSPSSATPAVAEGIDAVLRAASLPAVPSKLAETFSPTVLSGREGSRAMGPEEAWSRVDELEAYLGKGLMTEDLCFRLAEALAGGMMMRGSPPPWRTLVRDAVARRIASAGGLHGIDGGRRPLVVHFIAAEGQERLHSVLRLLEAESYPAPPSESRTAEDCVLTPSRDPAGNTSVEARSSATLKRVAPLLVDARPTKLGAKHHWTNSWSAQGCRGGGSGGNTVFGSPPIGRMGYKDHLLREQRESIALEMIVTRERAASFTAAENQAAGGSDFAVGLAFDEKWVASLAPGATTNEKAGARREEEEYEARRQRASATLSGAEYKGWELREEISGYRRQEEQMRAQIFNGDPLLPLWGGLGRDRGEEGFHTSPP